MTDSIKTWIAIYEKLKDKALCMDIECCYWNGPISLVGIYKPTEGQIISESFVKGQNLTRTNLKHAFKDCKLLITYNGLKFDVPKLQKDFPGTLPKKIPTFDIYIFSKLLGINTNLKVLETSLGIERHESVEGKRHVSTRLWKRWSEKNDKKALDLLIEYNRQDVINMYPLAEKLIDMAKEKTDK